MIKINDVEIKLVIQGITNEGSKDSVARTLSFGVLYPSAIDSEFEKYEIKCGDKVEYLVNDVTVFYGYIESVDYSTDSQVVNVQCQDLMNYLVKSKPVKRFTGTLVTIANEICSLFNITNGIESDRQENHNIVSNADLTYYDIIYTACKSLYGRDFNLYMDKDTLKLVTLNTEPVARLEIGKNLISAGYSSSISDMVNKLLIIKDNYIISSVQNTSDIEKFGLFQDTYNYQKEKNNIENARAKLKTIENTADISAMGDILCKSGYIIEIYEPTTNLSGKFEIISDSHNFNIEYIMNLGVKYIG